MTFEGRHLGVRQRFTARITRFEPPHLFEDQMVRGAFRTFRHRHEFRPAPGGQTEMVDTITYEASLGLLGRLAAALVLTRYLRRFLSRRSRYLQQVAEEAA